MSFVYSWRDLEDRSRPKTYRRDSAHSSETPRSGTPSVGLCSHSSRVPRGWTVSTSGFPTGHSRGEYDGRGLESGPWQTLGRSFSCRVDLKSVSIYISPDQEFFSPQSKSRTAKEQSPSFTYKIRIVSYDTFVNHACLYG